MNNLFGTFEYCNINIEDNISETAKEIIQRQDTDKYTYKYTYDNRTKVNKQQKQNVQYYIKFHDNENYEVKQKFKDNSKLFKYLKQKLPGVFQEHIKEYALYDIILSIIQICKKEKLYDQENPNIIVCDHYMRYTLDTEAFHLIDLIDIIHEHIANKYIQDRNYFYTNYEIPININDETEYINSLINPHWTKLNAIMVRAAHETKNTIRFRYYELDTDLFNVLSKAGHINIDEQIIRYDKLVSAFFEYIYSNTHIFKNRKTHKNMIKIKNTPLQFLGISYLHKHQIKTILVTKITKYIF